MSTNKRPNISFRPVKSLAVVGLGRQGYQHFLAALKLRKLGLLARLVSCDPANAWLEADEHYLNYFEMLGKEQLDCVVIAVPNIWHSAMTMAALRKNIGVIKETPIAINLDQAKHFQRVAARHSVSIITCQQRFFRPEWLELQRLLRVMGQVVDFSYTLSMSGEQSSWYGDLHQAGGGVWLNMGWQVVQMVEAVLGQITQIQLASRYAGQQPWQQQLDHTSQAKLTLSNGVTGSVLVSSEMPTQERLRVTTTTGVIELLNSELAVWIDGKKQLVKLREKGSLYDRQLEQLLKKIENGQSTIEPDLRTLELILEAEVVEWPLPELLSMSHG